MGVTIHYRGAIADLDRVLDLAFFPHKAAGLIDASAFSELHATIEGLQNDAFDELRRRRAAPGGNTPIER